MGRPRSLSSDRLRPRPVEPRGSMPDTIRCPGCGAENERGAEACAHCNFPLGEQGAQATTPAAAEAGEPEFKFDPGPRPVRPRRARAEAMQPIQMQIWLFTGIAAVLGLV